MTTTRADLTRTAREYMDEARNLPPGTGAAAAIFAADNLARAVLVYCAAVDEAVARAADQAVVDVTRYRDGLA